MGVVGAFSIVQKGRNHTDVLGIGQMEARRGSELQLYIRHWSHVGWERKARRNHTDVLGIGQDGGRRGKIIPKDVKSRPDIVSLGTDGLIQDHWTMMVSSNAPLNYLE
nr:hypothetical protein Iba_chr07aCG1530 [Ipomoea batatas]